MFKNPDLQLQKITPNNPITPVNTQQIPTQPKLLGGLDALTTEGEKPSLAEMLEWIKNSKQ